MATKRTKADNDQRQSDQLEKKSERRPEQGTSKIKLPKDFSRAAGFDRKAATSKEAPKSGVRRNKTRMYDAQQTIKIGM